MKSTKPELAKCQRCGDHVLQAHVAGLRTVVDLSPLTIEQVRAHLMSGGGLYRLEKQVGVPYRLHMVDQWTNLTEAHLVKDHGCEARSRTTARVEVVEAPKALHASSSPRSDLPAIRCAKCRRLIPEGDPDRFQVIVPVWQVNEHKIPNRGTRKGGTKIFEGWGESRWAIHSEGCADDQDHQVPTQGRLGVDMRRTGLPSTDPGVVRLPGDVEGGSEGLQGPLWDLP